MATCFRLIILISASILTPHLTASEIKSATLENGLTLIGLESNKVPLVTIVLASKAGGMTEEPSTNGLTHLWEHMFFKGNKEIPDQEAFKRKIRQLGIVYNGDTSAETVRYYFTLPSAYLTEGLEFMFHAINSPLLDQKELEKERKVVLNEYDRSASQPGFNLRKLRKRLIYGKQDYLRDPLGERTIIEKATRQQLLKIKDEVFVPKNSSILVAGDIKFPKLLEQVRGIFSSWQNPPKWKLKKLPPFAPFPPSQRVTMIDKQATNATVTITFQGPKARHQPKDSFAADVLISLLSLQSGTFQKKFVESGLTFRSNLGYYTQSQAGELNLYAITTAQKLEKVIDLFEKEILAWAKPDYFTKEQLKDVQRSMLVSHKFELNQPSSFIKSLGFWWTVTGLSYYKSYLPNLRKVTLDDVTAFVKKYLVNQPRITTVLVDPKGAKEAKIKDNSQKLWKKLFN